MKVETNGMEETRCLNKRHVLENEWSGDVARQRQECEDGEMKKN